MSEMKRSIPPEWSRRVFRNLNILLKTFYAIGTTVLVAIALLGISVWIVSPVKSATVGTETLGIIGVRSLIFALAITIGCPLLAMLSRESNLPYSDRISMRSVAWRTAGWWITLVISSLFLWGVWRVLVLPAL